MGVSDVAALGVVRLAGSFGNPTCEEACSLEGLSYVSGSNLQLLFAVRRESLVHEPVSFSFGRVRKLRGAILNQSFTGEQ